VELPLIGAHTAGHDGLDLPRPLRSGLAIAAVGLLPLLLGLTAVIRPLSGLVFAGIFLVAGALQWSLAYYGLVGIRRRADSELRLETRPHLQTSRVKWRASELTSDRHRTALARSVVRTERDLSAALLPGASPLNRVAARPHADLFLRLAERLAALDRPVSARAVLQVEELLTSPESPLYARERARELRASLLACLDALDGVPDALAAESSPASGQRPVPVDGKRGRGLAAMTSERRTDSLGAAHSRLRRFAVARSRGQR
jgi:hypothetical protein